MKYPLLPLLLAAILSCSTMALSPLMVKRLRRAVQAQRLHEQKQQVQHSPPVRVNDKLDLHQLHKEWSKELEQLQHYEHAIFTDPDLSGVVEKVSTTTTPRLAVTKHHDDEHDQQHVANLEYRSQESHRHDSLLDEIAHSIETDPYLRP